MSFDKFCRFTLFDKFLETCAKQDAVSIYLIVSGQPLSLCVPCIFIQVLCVPLISISFT